MPHLNCLYSNQKFPIFNKTCKPRVLYCLYKENGLIGISLPIGLGGLGWAMGLYRDRKSGKARHGLPRLNRNHFVDVDKMVC